MKTRTQGRTGLGGFRLGMPLVAVFVIAALVAANAAVVAVVAARSHPRATNWPGPSFTFWPERRWSEVEEAIDALAGAKRLSRSVLGTVEYRGTSYPVHLLSFAARGPDRPRVLLVGSIHGTEPAGGRALLELADGMVRDPSLLADVAVDIVPIANPWGWVHGYRYTGNGEDINRDFASARTQESVLLRGLMRERGPYDLVMDLHESKKAGYFVYEYLPPDEGLGSSFTGLVEAAGERLEDRYHEWFWRAEDGVLRVPTVALWWVALARQLSLEHYARLHGTRHAYTVETPVDDELADRVRIHRRAVAVFVRRITDEAARAGDAAR
ncbi:MAG: DUF2817 domain-containing protein [Spirochaetes bacterium]|nr:DUF2817 domain-containing protein [Spirochaetota bacterium]